MKYELNGISLPFGGISWNKAKSKKDIFSFLLIYLESKRILVNPIEMEKKEWCMESVLEIKKQLVTITEKTDFKKDDLAIIRNMIEACNQYLDTVSKMDLPFIICKNQESKGMWSDLNFDNGLENHLKMKLVLLKSVTVLPLIKQYLISFRRMK